MLSTVELTWNIKTGSLLNKLTNVRIKQHKLVLSGNLFFLLSLFEREKGRETNEKN